MSDRGRGGCPKEESSCATAHDLMIAQLSNFQTEWGRPRTLAVKKNLRRSRQLRPTVPEETAMMTTPQRRQPALAVAAVAAMVVMLTLTTAAQQPTPVDVSQLVVPPGAAAVEPALFNARGQADV